MAQRRVLTPLPYPVQAALVDASGKVFWFWDAYEHYIRSCGVHDAVVARCRATGGSKYGLMRELLRELSLAGTKGQEAQKRLVRAMVTHPLSERDNIDVTVAKEHQDRLRVLAEEHGVLARPQPKEAQGTTTLRQRQAAARALQQRRHEAEEKRAKLHREYCALLTDDSDRQGRGYRLEEMLGEVAVLDGLKHKPPFRKGTVTQTDGMVEYMGFQYLVEARWRADEPDVNAVTALGGKAARNLQSTRGLFLSVVGFRPEVVTELQTGVKNVLLMSGQEFALILEGRLTLGRALQLKVEEGANRGRIFYDLAQAAYL